MNTDYLRTFIEIVRRGTFSEAAKQLGISQPAVTLQVQRLEREVGARLLNRSDTPISLTAAGQRFHAFAAGVVEQEEWLRAGLRDLDETVNGVLLIGGSTVPGEYLVPRLVTAFCARFPGAVPKVSIGDTGEVVSWVLDDTVRVGFVGAEPADHRLKTLPFARDEIILVVSPAHPWAQRGTIELRELAGERVLMREGGSGTLRNVIERLKLEGVALGGGDSPSFGSTQAILTAVEAGFGAAFVSRVAAAAGLSAEKYKEVALADTRLVRDLYITYVEERLDSRLLHQFVAFAETWSA